VALWDWLRGAWTRPQPVVVRKESATAAAKSGDAQYNEAVAVLRAAAARKDLPETLRLSEDLRTRHPERADGYRFAVTALRESKRFGEANALLDDATARFPDDAWPLVEATWVAHLSGDREAALARAAELRKRFPANQTGYRVAAVALRESKRLDEIDALLRDAMARFPGEEWPLVESVWAAYGSGVREAAILRAQQLRARFPANQAGYRIAAAALRESKRFDEMDGLLGEAMTRFPDEAWPLEEAAWIALAQDDREAAIQRAEVLRTRFPLQQAGYRVGLDALRRMNRLDEANAVLREAETRFPGASWAAPAK
jgi:predicted Zn-dependent protease